MIPAVNSDTRYSAQAQKHLALRTTRRAMQHHPLGKPLHRHSRTPPLSFPHPPLSFPQSLSGNPYWIMPALIRLTQNGFPLKSLPLQACKQGTAGMTRTKYCGNDANTSYRIAQCCKTPNLGICTPSPIIINTCCSAICRFQPQQVQQQQGQLDGRLQHQNTHHSLSLRSPIQYVIPQ